MKAILGTFNKEKAQVTSRDLLFDCKIFVKICCKLLYHLTHSRWKKTMTAARGTATYTRHLSMVPHQPRHPILMCHFLAVYSNDCNRMFHGFHQFVD